MGHRRHEGFGIRAASAAALAALLTAVTATAVADGHVRSTIAVTARVAGTAVIEQRAVPAELAVTPLDLERDFVTARATLTVRSNSREGFQLSVWPRADWFETVEIRGDSASATLPAEGGALIWREPGVGSRRITLELTFRPRPGVTPTALPWPLEFQVSAL
jgi:hypothetical protein